MTPEEAALHVALRLQTETGDAEELTGGLLNYVYRVGTADGTVVVKHAAPHLRSEPRVRLDPSRAGFEADALRWLQDVGAAARTPRLLDQHNDTLILEDLGDAPDLGDYLQGGGDPAILDELASFVRWLHEQPGHDRVNEPVQATRLTVQYEAVVDWLEAADVADAKALGSRAVALGRRLLARGDCFVMGDLWPRSIRVRDGLELIDWELSTVGRRAQDLGHLAAHLWIGGHRGLWAEGLAERFLGSYGPLSGPDAADVADHMGCEILIRSIGSFRSGGAYEGVPDQHPQLREAVAMGAGLLRGGA